MWGVTKAAKTANGRSRACAKCKHHGMCTLNIHEVCNAAFIEGFQKGAQWRINSVWHDAEEIPKHSGRDILLETKSYDGIVRYYVNRAEFYEKHPFNERWAYVSDLLPTKTG